MPGKIEALAILLLLLPGFACAYIVQHLAVRAKQSELEKIVEALLLSFVLYLATLPFFGYTLPVSWSSTSVGGFAGYAVLLHWSHLAGLLASAAALGLLHAANINHDLLLRVLRRLRITQRTARNTIWNDAFQDVSNKYILVSFADGSSLLGYLRYYSDESEDSSLFLEDAAWVFEDGSQEQIPGPGILITKQAALEFVTFLDPAEEGEVKVPSGATEWSASGSTRHW